MRSGRGFIGWRHPTSAAWGGSTRYGAVSAATADENSDARRPIVVTGTRLFVGIGRPQHKRVFVTPPDDLQSGWEARICEARPDRRGRMPGEIERRRAGGDPAPKRQVVGLSRDWTLGREGLAGHRRQYQQVIAVEKARKCVIKPRPSAVRLAELARSHL